MINAWRLLYDEVLKMKTDHYFDEMPENIANQFTEAFEDFDIDLITGYKMKDLTNENGFWKYEEDKTLNEVKNYLSGTYKSHYTSQESKTQTLDLIESIGDAEAFCRSNAIKYLSRFGKKNGKSKTDILKAIHYCILLYHFSGVHKQTSSYPQ
jgi:hypothetical protein